MSIIFMTGFPGFLGSELLPRLLSRDPAVRAVCLVQGKFAALARVRVDELAAVHAEIAGRIEIVEGDITRPGLGLAETGDLRKQISEIYHLAAIYDLGVGRELAMRVNVEGTTNTLEFAADCAALRRFQYVSTCYVSGTHPGLYSEDDLDRGQRFNNFYEETKFLAEVEVQKCMRLGIPATIYRPAIVVGDSRTGSTQKYDGPYSVMRLLLRQPRVAIMPVIGDAKATQINVVPRDFVLDAMAYLSGRPETNCRVFQLADPDPLTVDEMVSQLAVATGRKIIRVPLALQLAKFSLRRVPGMRQLIQVPPDALDYFVHPTRYGTKRTQTALQGSGIRCPRFPEYVNQLVGFVRAHPEIGSAAMA